MHKNNAFSLLELMLAIAFGTIILSGIYGLYISVKSLYIFSIENSRIQENIRFASNFLLKNITMSGYSGCNKIQDLDLSNLTGQSFSLTKSLQGFSSANPPSYLKGQVVPDTDVLVIQKTDVAETNVIGTAKIDVGAKTIKVKATPATKDDRILFIADCHNADLFKSDNYTGTDIKVDPQTPIAHQYDVGVGTTVGRFTEVAFFISNVIRDDNNGKMIYALYEVINGGNKQELVENIRSMKIKYGVDSQSKGVVDSYYSAEQITAAGLWDKVLAVIITLVPDVKNVKLQEWSVYIKLRER